MQRIATRSMWMSTAALVAAVFACAAPPAMAQGRLSLSERVQRLESQAQSADSNQSKVELLNRVNELQAELQSLRGLVEQQKFEIESLKNANRAAYADLNSRLDRLEGRAPTTSTNTPLTPAPLDGGSTTLQQTPPPAPPAPGQLAMEEPELAQPRTDPALATPQAEPPPAPEPTVPPALGEKAAYDEAFATLREGRYAESARRFTAFLQQYPDGEYGDNARYWLGESYYVTQNYKIALDTFNGLLKRSPASSKAPDALLKIGFCYYELRDWASAEAALNDVVTKYPDTTVARLAQGRLRALKLEGRR